MSGYLDELERQLANDRDLASIRPLLRRAVAQLIEWRNRIQAGWENIDERVERFEERILIVDTLPTEAPYGALIRVRTGTLAERAALYTGNGPGQPLGKITPTAL